jgi:predicted nucleic acid-binding protein
MPTVSNTSPILNLAIIDHLDLLRAQFAQVIIPPHVLDELKLETDFPGTESIRQALQSGWLRVVELKDVYVSRALALELDRGEAAAIALALELGGSPILMDEHEGRTKAKALGLQPVGVLGVLLRAKRDGSLDSVYSAAQALRHRAGFFIADTLLAQVLVDAGECQ